MLFNNKIKLSNGKYLYYNVLNGRELEIYSPSLVHSLDDTGYIDKIFVPHDVYMLKVGGTFQFLQNNEKKAEYDVNYINKMPRENAYIISSHIENQVGTYLLPSLGLVPITKETKNKYSPSTIKEIERFGRTTYLVTAYLNKEHDVLKLVYKFATWELYIDLESELKRHKNFLKVEDNGKYVNMYFSIPKEFQKDVSTFKNGVFSQLSKELKYRILSYLKSTDDYEIIKGILTKDAGLRKLMEARLDVRMDESYELDSKPTENDYYE